MRIVHLVHQFLPETRGGVESYVHDLALAQRERGHDPRIITGSLEPRPQVEAECLDLDGLEVWRCHRDDLYFDAWDRMHAPAMTDLVLAKVAELAPDLVHLHHWIRLGQDLGSRLVAAGHPLVVTLHDFATSCPRAFRMRPDETPCFRPLGVASCLDCVPRWPWMDDVEIAAEIDLFARSARQELRGAGRIICASASVREVITEGLGISTERFEVAALGYRPRFGRKARALAAGEPFRFGYWGSITHRKGLHLLVEAIRSVQASRPAGARPIELEVFGHFDLPERRASLEAAAEGLPIRFHGGFEHAQLPDAGLAAAVFPSLCIETYGIVLDEAFELGLPVVVPDIGALAERAGSAGHPFKVNDVGSLARALGAVADDDALRADLIAAIPGPGPELANHVDLIDRHYRAAIEDGPAASARARADGISAEERLRHQSRRMQSQFRRLLERGELP
ncbi:MAG: glycosyltransferase [Planctomycetes bacterium]|nr:glycosyltransferase [Planctomycetota bacterium]